MGKEKRKQKKLKILAAGDIHGDTRVTEKLAEKAKRENVDLVILTGDLTFAEESTEGLLKPFAKAKKEVLLIPGNHETVATAKFLTEVYNNVRNIHGYSVKYGDVGIFARHSKDLNFQGVVVQGNQSHGCFLSHNLIGTSTGVTRLFFEACSFIDNGGYGFWLASPASESPGNTIAGCLFSGNSQGAIKIDQGGVLFESGNVEQ